MPFSAANRVFLRKSHFVNKLYKLIIALGLIKILRFFANRIDKEIRFINSQNFDLIIFPAGDAVACLVNSNVIGAIHDLMHRYERPLMESSGVFGYGYRENLFKSLLNSAKAILVDSLLGEQQIRESYENIKAKICILPFIAPDYIYLHPNNNESKLINSVEPLKYIFYPAQFWIHKNHINLLRALKILKDRGIIIDLVLSGTKDRGYRSLTEYVRKNNLSNQVKFAGYISDHQLIDLYRNALALVMPTYYGPTNIPPIEAVLLGCPPIISNIYGMPEQFEDAALYFDPGNPGEIADRIESVIVNEEYREKIIKKGERIKGKFSQERFRNDIRDILQELLETN
jgi:glycosyltransferase involved in cell wall biosynthesis